MTPKRGQAHANELGRRLHTIGKAAGAGVEEEEAAVEMKMAVGEGSADKWHIAEPEARIRELEEETIRLKEAAAKTASDREVVKEVPVERIVRPKTQIAREGGRGL